MGKQNKNRSQSQRLPGRSKAGELLEDVSGAATRMGEDVRGGAENMRGRGRDGATDIKSKARNKR